MKIISCTITFLLLINLSFLFAQTKENPIIIKQFEGLEYGGECPLVNLTLHREEGMNVKTFSFVVPVAGEYFVSAWISGELEKGAIKDIFIKTDNESKSKTNLKLSKGDWQALMLKKAVYFSAGTHNISFASEGESVPAVDFITLAMDKEKARIDDNKYTGMMQELISGKNNGSTILNKTEGDPYTTNPGTPVYDYAYAIDQPVKYTYMGTMYLYDGYSYTIETGSNSPSTTDPVLYIYKLSGTGEIVFHRSDDNSKDGINARITFTPLPPIPDRLSKVMDVNPGSYYNVLIRAKSSSTEGTVALIRGASTWTNCAVKNVRHYCSNRISSGATFNYFTTNNEFDTKLFLEDDLTTSSGYGTLVAFNDNYSSSSGFSWGNASRIKSTINNTKLYAIVLPYSSNDAGAYYDIYMKCRYFTGSSTYYIHVDDGMIAENMVQIYSCFAYAGGISNENITQSIITNIWQQAGESRLKAFDDYFGNVGTPRYNGAVNYVRTYSTDPDRCIKLFASNENVNANFNHAAIKKGSDSNLHGYNWESKLGSGYARIFHTESSFTGYSIFGSYHYFYKKQLLQSFCIVPGAKIPPHDLTLEESIAGGYSIMDIVELSKDEEKALKEMQRQLSNQKKIEFREKLENWKNSIKNKNYDHENLKDDSYVSLLEWSQTNRDITLPLLTEEYFIDSENLDLLIYDLLIPEYNSVIEEIKKECMDNQINEKKAYIVRFTEHYLKRFLKRLTGIEKTKESISPGKQNNDNENESNSEIILEQSYPNPANPSTVIKFNLPDPINVSLIIYDILGKEICRLIDNENYVDGWHNFMWNGTNSFNQFVSSGTYIYRLRAGTKVLSGKIIMMK